MAEQQRAASDLRFALLLALPVLVFLVLVVAYPLGYAVWLSLHQIQFFGGYQADFVGLDNFRAVITDNRFWWSAWVSVRFTIESVVLAMLIGALGGGISLSLAESHSKAAVVVACISAMFLAFVVLVIDTNAANVL